MTWEAGGRSGGLWTWRGWPMWRRATKRSESASEAARRPASVRSSPGRAPVAGEAAGVRGEEDDVAGDRRRVQVLLVLDLVAGDLPGGDDEGRAAVELRRRLRPRSFLQGLQCRRPDDAEAPGRGQVVVRSPAGEIEQLLDLGPRDRLGGEGLVGTAGADCGLDIHLATSPGDDPATRSPASASSATHRRSHRLPGRGRADSLRRRMIRRRRDRRLGFRCLPGARPRPLRWSALPGRR